MPLVFVKGAPQEVELLLSYSHLNSSLFIDLGAFGLDLDLDLNRVERQPDPEPVDLFISRSWTRYPGLATILLSCIM